MGIKQDPADGTWTAFHSMRHPVLRTPRRMARKRLKSKAEAIRVEKELVRELAKKLEEKTVPRWKQVVDECLASKLIEGWTDKTHFTYQSCLYAHTSDWDLNRIDQILPHQIREKVLVELNEKSESHKKSVLKFIRCVFTFAIENGYLNTNPTPNLKFRVGDKVKSVLTESQCKAFIEKARELESEWYPIWKLAVHTGMRSGELYALEWKSVDFENCRIVVNTSWNNKDGFKETKSGDDRVIPISKSLKEFLMELKGADENGPFVLPRLRKWEKGEQARELRMFLVGMGLPPVRFHDLRATWATVMLSNGVEPIKVMMIGGWKDMKTMMRYVRDSGISVSGTTDFLSF